MIALMIKSAPNHWLDMKDNQLEEARDDDRVLSFRNWCVLAGVSPATGRRLIASGNGPRIIQLSTRRIGIRPRDHRAWLDARVREMA